MNNLKKALDELKFDNRMVGLNIQNGSVTKDEYAQHLSQLQDLADRCESLEIDSSNHSDDSMSGSNGYSHDGFHHQ